MILYNENSVPEQKQRVIALGTFDGLHMAHKEILKTAKFYAKQNNMDWGVLLFDKNPQNIVSNKNVKCILSNEDKIDLLFDCDYIFYKKFDEAFMKLSCENFIQFLIEKLNIKAICVGYNYRFGYKGAGDSKTLLDLGEKYGIEVLITSQQKHKDEIISSTLIRKYISEGNISGANELLGRYFYLKGEVVKGFQNGRKMGLPTANIYYSDNCIIPKNGVYAGITVVDGKEYKSVINVGSNPTFNGKKITVESHLLEFNQDIYGKIIKVCFLEHIRDDIKFNSMEELKNQIHKDIEITKNIM